MTTKTTIVLALAAGFIGGIVSQRLVPAVVSAQDQSTVPDEIRAHKFVLVDDDGVSRGVFGFAARSPRFFGHPTVKLPFPAIETMDAKGEVWSFPMNQFANYGLLPDATCQACVRKPSKTGP